MDGTLIDSEPYWMEAETRLAARFGVDWTHEDGLTLVGNPLDVSAAVLIARGVDLPADQVIDALVTEVAERAAAAMPWQNDARDLLNEVVAAGIPCALVTMSIGALVDRFLEAVGPVFSVVVTGDQVARGKPDPESYLRAAELLGVDAADCVAIEDSRAGIASAHASGAATVAVRRHTDLPDLEGLTRVTTLEGIGVEGLSRIVAERREAARVALLRG